MSTIKDTAITKATPEMAGLRLSPNEFDSIDEWEGDCLYELVRGVLVVVPPPSAGERGPNDVLGYLLHDYKQRHAQGSALDWTLPENQVRTADSRRRADRVIWTGLGRMPRADKDLPTIAIEFVSAGKRDARRDYIDKRDEYLAIGLREYWIIDRFRRTMTVIRRDGAEVAEFVIGEHEAYSTPLLPGFKLELEKLLSVAQALGDPDDCDA